MSKNMNGHLLLHAKDAVIQTFDWGELHWYANSQIGNSQTMTVGQCILKPGCENPRHFHPNCDEILRVVQGRIQHSIADEAVEMGPGDTISIPADIVHNALNIGTEDAIMMIVFSSSERQTVGEF
jgi:quercetin dioxygenase-like cupin family protein